MFTSSQPCSASLRFYSPAQSSIDCSARSLAGATITELRPLIYGLLFAEAERRKAKASQRSRPVWWIVPAFYLLAMAVISTGSGYTWSEAPFWLMFLPIVAGTELAIWELTRSRPESPLRNPHRHEDV